MSIAIQISGAGVREMQRLLLQVESGAAFDEVLEGVGGLIESQVKRRIADEKASPAGEDWPGWSEGYRQSRHGGHSLLQSDDGLLDSIQYLVSGDDSVEIGSNLIYAATHQFGDEERNIPEREYLGLSDEDIEEIETMILDLLMEAGS